MQQGRFEGKSKRTASHLPNRPIPFLIAFVPILREDWQHFYGVVAESTNWGKLTNPESVWTMKH
jgi:hypothetical protein